MLNVSHYRASETLPNGLRLLIRATEPQDDVAGAIQRNVSPKSFFYRFLRPKHYLTDEEVTSFVNCDFVSQVGLIGLVRDNLRMAIVAGARYWITLLPGTVSDDKSRTNVLDSPRRREAAGGRHGAGLL